MVRVLIYGGPWSLISKSTERKAHPIHIINLFLPTTQVWKIWLKQLLHPGEQTGDLCPLDPTVSQHNRIESGDICVIVWAIQRDHLLLSAAPEERVWCPFLEHAFCPHCSQILFNFHAQKSNLHWRWILVPLHQLCFDADNNHFSGHFSFVSLRN